MDGGLYRREACTVKRRLDSKSLSGPSSDKVPCARGQAPSQRERCSPNADEARLESFFARGLLLLLPMSTSRSREGSGRAVSFHVPTRTRYRGWLALSPATARQG